MARMQIMQEQSSANARDRQVVPVDTGGGRPAIGGIARNARSYEVDRGRRRGHAPSHATSARTELALADLEGGGCRLTFSKTTG